MVLAHLEHLADVSSIKKRRERQGVWFRVSKMGCLRHSTHTRTKEYRELPIVADKGALNPSMLIDASYLSTPIECKLILKAPSEGISRSVVRDWRYYMYICTCIWTYPVWLLQTNSLRGQTITTSPHRTTRNAQKASKPQVSSLILAWLMIVLYSDLML